MIKYFKSLLCNKNKQNLTKVILWMVSGQFDQDLTAVLDLKKLREFLDFVAALK